MKERKRKLKPFVMPMVYALAFTALVLSLSVIDTIQNKQVSKADDNYTYVNNSIISSNVPVVKEETTEVTIKPFKSDNVEIAKNSMIQMQVTKKNKMHLYIIMIHTCKIQVYYINQKKHLM